MKEALYRKYRPKKLTDVIGQEHITQTLKHALEQGVIRHAYLFTGPRGVGKTSVARILAHEINKLPYTDDSTHLDIIEIDAASNRRIDEIRDLRDKVNIVPTSSPYKVYIIDEVHMLTKEAFNALLKTLEEPPKHVVFILATTEVHKVPATIISRTQRFPFRQMPPEALKKLLDDITKKEKYRITDEALTKIAEHSDGSGRDALSLLDQVAAYEGEVDIQTIESLLGLPSEEHVDAILQALSRQRADEVLAATQALRVDGQSPPQFASLLANRLRYDLGKPDALITDDKALQLLKDLLLIGTYSDPMSALEVALLQTIVEGSTPKPVAKPVAHEPQPASQPQPEKPLAKAETPKPHVKKTPESAKAELTASEQPKPKPAATGELNWPDILNRMKSKYNSLYGLLRMAEFSRTSEGISLAFKFPFHAKQLKQTRNFERLREALSEAGQPDIAIDITVNADALPPEIPETPKAKQDTKESDQDIQTVSNIFGTAELLD